jgi:hypothetical protein
MTIPMKQPAAEDAIESALMQGDLSKLSAPQRLEHYRAVCKSLGLNPLTQPFAYIVLNGKLQLYALRNCADQLRELKKVSLKIVSRDVSDGVLTIHVQASLPDGRCDEDLGAVPFPESLKGEARANAELKCITKAKRRATLSICGLGWLDETEVESIPGARKAPVAAPDVVQKPEPPPVKPAVELLDAARSFAKRGSNEFTVFFRPLTQAQRDTLVPHGAELRELMNEADDDIARDEAAGEHNPETGEVA